MHKGFISVFKKKTVMFIIFAVALSLSVVTTVITYYGQNVGNFVIGVGNDGFECGLVLSDTKDFKVKGPRLVGEAISDVHPISLDQIYTGRVVDNDGVYVSSSGNYVGYTFYLMNEGNMSINVDVSINISKVNHYVDRACWVWFFEGEDDTEGTIYKKKDLVTDKYPPEYSQYNIVDYDSDETVVKSGIERFRPGEIKKYSIIIWLEGADPDCTNEGEYSIISGNIRYSVLFDIREEEM